MIYKYGVSVVGGSYHRKHDIPCQDNHAIVKCSDEIIVAAVADGLGSAEHSAIGSEIASKKSVEYCAQKIDSAKNADEILALIRDGFSLAQRSIEEEAEEKGHLVELYDTTLTLSILINDTLYFGHSGDSGIVVLTTLGLYKAVTEQQRDEEGRVFPLVFRDRWVIEEFHEKVTSVLLATDGMLETFFPYLIKDEPVNIHVNLARFFMDKESLYLDEDGEDAVQTRMESFITSLSDQQVNDDRTIVVLLNTSVESKLQPEKYYEEPDWVELKREYDKEWRRQAYPHLYEEDTAEDGASNETETLEEESVVNKDPDEKGEDCISSEDDPPANDGPLELTDSHTDIGNDPIKPKNSKKKEGFMRLFRK